MNNFSDPQANTAVNVAALLDEENITHGHISLKCANNNWGFSDGSHVWVKVSRMRTNLLATELRATTELRSQGFEAPEALINSVRTVKVGDTDQNVTVWRFIPYRHMRPDVECVVAASDYLHSVHAANVYVPTRELFLESTIAWATRTLSGIDTPPLAIELLDHMHRTASDVEDALLRSESEYIFVHGDAHVGNIVETEESTLFIDWENAMIAPREWDFGKLVPPALDGTMPCGNAKYLSPCDSEIAWERIRTMAGKLDMNLVVSSAMLRMASSAVYSLGFLQDEHSAEQVCDYLSIERRTNLSRHW